MKLEATSVVAVQERPENKILAAMRRWWDEGQDYQKLGYILAAALLVGGLFHAVVWFVVGGSMTETISWRKPTTFLTACGVTAGTFIWSLNYLKIDKTTGWQLAIGVLAPATIVSSAVAFQQWRGTRSHFNFFESPFDAAIAALLVIMIQMLLPTAVIYSRLTFTALKPVATDLALALRAGILMVNVSFFIGFITIMNAVTNGLLFTIHTSSVIGTAGTMKLPHGVAMHGLQFFLLLVGMMQFSNWCAKRRLIVVQLAVAGWGLLVALSVFQTLAGFAPLAWSLPVTVLVMLGLSLMVVAFAMALSSVVLTRLQSPRTQTILTNEQ
jgi:hypothetical protein